MKTEIKEIWVEALQSGNYQQGIEFLNKDGKFCCLGVLCDLAIKAGVDVEISKSEDNLYATAYDGESSFLPHSVQKWAGMQTSDGCIHEHETDYDMDSLSDQNDQGRSFAEIANVIDKYGEYL